MKSLENDYQVRTILGRLHQFIAVITCGLPISIYALGLVWPSYSIRMLNSPESPLMGKTLTSSDTALLASLPVLSSIIAKIPASYLMHKFGTKKCGFVIGISLILAWLINILSTSILPLLVSRLFIGMSGGFAIICLTIFVADIAETAIRGTLSTSAPILLATGILLSYIIGASFSYHVINKIMMIFSVAYTVAVCFIPESPAYLMRLKKEKAFRVAVCFIPEGPVYLKRYKKNKEAAKSMAWYRGASVDSKLVKDSLDLLRSHDGIVKLQDDEPRNTNMDQVHKDGIDGEMESLRGTPDWQRRSVENQDQISSWQFLRKSPSSIQSLISVILLFIFQTLMGSSIVMVYAGPIMIDATPSMSPDTCSILLGIFNLIGTLLAMLTVEKIGRKLLMITTSLIVGVILTVVALVVQNGFGPGWLPASLLCLYVIVFFIGPGTIPYVWATELFFPEVRGLSTTICLQTNALVGCICLAIFPALKNSLGLNKMLYIFSGFSILAAMFTFLVFPETKGLTVDEIQVHFGTKKKTKTKTNF